MKSLQKKKPFAFYICGRIMNEQADYFIAIHKIGLININPTNSETE
ncbi:MAG: hypothetical protein DID92_2727744001 [Candidatus Nitrotoga sp. SPKER]|nr:MAG: hypothetical protein DID92_2727744001 [Candidatus Nitrotoga sp. SPKER]